MKERKYLGKCHRHKPRKGKGSYVRRKNKAKNDPNMAD